jgi:hypothetical protein
VPPDWARSGEELEGQAGVVRGLATVYLRAPGPGAQMEGHRAAMSNLKRREFLKHTASTVGGTAVGIGLPAAIIAPNMSTLEKMCPVNTYLKGPVSEAALRLPWSAAALARLERVPAGFMRDVARTQGAKMALERGESEVSQRSVEDAIAHVTGWMNHTTRSTTA